MRLIEVPRDVYEPMEGHLMLVWETAGHTYALGFRLGHDEAATRSLDLAVARHLVMVKP
jgi:hypothetical protein